MKTIYQKFENAPALKRAGAYFAQKGSVSARIVFAYPADGAGKLTVFVHEYGKEMQTGSASGYGYDKKSAAINGLSIGDFTFKDSGDHFENELRDAGFSVYFII